ncbi:MAG: folate-binding protein [Rhodoferax sp.]|nr:folate-binding protein [Rhodoferax sp.]
MTDSIPILLPALPEGVARLSHWGVIRIQGEDAAKFIHGQVTQDFALLGPDQARLAAYCTPQGRVLATFVGCKTPEGDVLLVCPKDVMSAIIRRLSMFVLHAKARLSDATDAFGLWGLCGHGVSAGDAGSPPWSRHDTPAGTLIQLYPACGTSRTLLISPASAPPPAGPSMDLAHWQWGEVHSGIASVGADTSGAYVPQTLNYESVGGISFKKGCYPGQEVVARSQFRGTLKRRAFVAHCPTPMTPGQEILAHADADQVAGTVVQSAARPGGGYDAIVALQVASQNAPLSCQGSPLTLLPLPYSLLEDI